MLGRSAALSAAAAVLLSASAAAQPFPPQRPTLTIAADAVGCPEASGAFVVLLDAQRGMLLLSAAGYEGAHRLGAATSGERTVAVPGSGAWRVGRSSVTGDATLWGNVYPWRGPGLDGCVAFAKQRFSSEGDLVTYARYLAEEVYMSLPAEERRRFPSFHLGERIVSLAVSRPGYKSLSLRGSEGSTMAFSYPDTEGSLLLRPFVLDESTARLAIEAATSDSTMWQGAAKHAVGTFIAASGAPAVIDALALTVAVTGLSAEPAQDSP